MLQLLLILLLHAACCLCCYYYQGMLSLLTPWWVSNLLMIRDHQHVACLEMDVAVPMSVIQTCQFYARRYAAARPVLSGARSDSTVRSQVWCCQPDRRFQSLGKGATQALRAQLWSIDGLAHAMIWNGRWISDSAGSHITTTSPHYSTRRGWMPRPSSQLTLTVELSRVGSSVLEALNAACVWEEW